MPGTRIAFSIEELRCAVDTLLRNQLSTAREFNDLAETGEQVFDLDAGNPYVPVETTSLQRHTASIFTQQAAQSEALLKRLDEAWEIADTLVGVGGTKDFSHS